MSIIPVEFNSSSRAFFRNALCGGIMNKILIVEDGLEVQVLLKRALSGLQVELLMASSSAQAKQILQTQSVQLILLDIGLPDQDGLQFCSDLQADKKAHNIPVIFLTGSKDVANKVVAFSLGAEDYIEKPFNALELRARVESKLKKMANRREDQSILVKGQLHIDASTQRASITQDVGNSILLHLTPREFKLLFHLAKNEEHVLSREQLLNAVWNNQSEIYDRTVDSHISAIRKKLGPLSVYIESVSGQGYRFTLSKVEKKFAA